MRFGPEKLKFELAILAIALGFGSFAAAANSGITYQGRILKPDGQPLTGASVQFKMQIRSPDANNCLMYEEVQLLDMRNSGGIFALTMNDGSGTRTDSTGLNLDRVLSNAVGPANVFTFNPATCNTGSSYASSTGDGRSLVVLFKDETMTAFEPMPAQTINFAPFAFEAKQIAGFTSASLVRVAESDGSLDSVSPLSNANYTELLALIAGTSTQFTKQSAGAGSIVTSVGGSGNVASPATGSVWLDTTAGALKFYDGSAIRTVGTSGGSVTSVSSGTGLTGGPITSTGTLSLATLGAGGTGFKVTYDTYGRVTAAVALVEADIPTLSTAGHVVGSAITSGTIGGTTAINSSGTISSGAITSSGLISSPAMSTTAIGSQSLQVFETTNSFKVTIQAPASLAANYALTLPTTAGTSGQVLSTNGSGVLSWLSALSSSTGFANGGNSFGGIASLGTNDAYRLDLKTNNSARMTIDSTGNVGIGTTSPAASLDVGGTANIQGAATIATTLNMGASANATIASANGLLLTSSNNQSVTLQTTTNGGSVALNTYGGSQLTSRNATVGSNISLISGAQTSGAGFNILSKIVSGINQELTLNSTGSYTKKFYIGAQGQAAGQNGTDVIISSGVQGSTTNRSGDLILYASDTTGAGRAGNILLQTDGTTNYSGNVGIGTTAPTASLHLRAGTATASTAPLKLTTGTLMTTPEDGAFEYASSNLYYTIGSTRYVVPMSASAGNYTNVSSISNSSGSITMTPMAGNSVVVNAATVSTSSTTGALVVNGGVGVAGAVNASGNIVSGGSITATVSAYTPQIYGSTLASGNIKIDGTDHATKGNVLLASAGGNVGIGTTSPLAALHVSGSTAGFRIDRTNSGQGVFGQIDAYSPSANTRISSYELPAYNSALLFSTKGDGIQNSGVVAERMRIDGLGNVGIGTTNPTDKLQVVGNISFPDSGGAATYGINRLGYNDVLSLSLSRGASIAGNVTNQDQLLYSANNSHILSVPNLAGADKVALTIDPNYNLILGSAIKIDATERYRTITTPGNTGNSNGDDLKLTTGPGYSGTMAGTILMQPGLPSNNPNISGAGVTIAGGISTGNAAGGAITFKTAPAGASGLTQTVLSTVMTVAASGNVGIGTTAPTAVLQLKAGTAAASSAPLKLTTGVLMTTPEDGAFEYASSNLYYTIGATRYVIPLNTAAGNYSNVSTISNTSGSITMTPMAGNSVIVNAATVSTSTTTGALVVSGGAGISGAVNASGNILSGGSVTATVSAYTPQLYGSTAASGNIKIDGTDHATKGNVLLASAGGYVGIGTTSPGSPLSIEGSNTTAWTQLAQFNSGGGGGANSGAVISIQESTASTKSDGGRIYGGRWATPRGVRLAAVDWQGTQGIGAEYNFLQLDSLNNAAYINTNNTERLRIDSSGNVGIGTTSPIAGLDITNSLNATVAPNDSAIYLHPTWATTSNFEIFKAIDINMANPVSNPGSYSYSENPINIRNGANSLFTIWRNSTNNVHVGINSSSSPAYDLSVVGSGLFTNGLDSNSTIKAVIYTAATAGTNYSSPIMSFQGSQWNGSSSGTDRWEIQNLIGTGANPSSTLAFSHPSGTTGLTQYSFSGGNVGIGATSPSYPLVVNGSSSGVVTLQGWQTGGTDRSKLMYDNTANNASLTLGSASISQNTASAATELDFSGNVAIPNGSKLLLATNPGAANIQLNSTAGSNSTPALLFSGSQGSNPNNPIFRFWDTTSYSQHNLFGIGSGATYNEYFTVVSNGNVGIGTTAPTQKLQVAGNIAPAADATYDLGTSSLKFVNVYATSGVVNTSDARLKKDIQNSDLGLEFIESLRPVSYRWKEASDDKLHYGLIAQETKEAVANAKLKSQRMNEIDNVIVTHDQKTDQFGLRYTELISPLIKAVQELYQRIVGIEKNQDNQARTLQSVTSSTAKLEAENAAMKAWICGKDPSAPFCK